MKKIENVKNIGNKRSNIAVDLNAIEVKVYQQIRPRNKVTDESGLLTNKFD